jgi:transposase-like protein
MSKQRYRKFTPEFKREAVRLAESAEGPMTQVARELSVRVNPIYKWRICTSYSTSSSLYLEIRCCVDRLKSQ